MKRHQLITIHLVLSTFFLPFLLMMPASGVLYLLGQKGEQSSEKVAEINGELPPTLSEKEEFFKTFFKESGSDFEFEYIREGGDQLIFRPATRVHRMAKIKDGTIEIYEVKPNLIKKMVELHKGHGPRLFRSYEIAFGIGLILMALSGVWLSLLVPAYRLKLFGSFAAGLFVFILFLLL